MSAELPSSNPFRRKQNYSTLPPASQENPSSLNNHTTYRPADPLTSITNLPKLEPSEKSTKKVRVQSPPPPSPSIPDSASTIGEDAYSGAGKSPKLMVYNSREDSLSSEAKPMSEDDGESGRAVHPPANPFSRTLETMQHSAEVYPPTTAVTNPGRASLDVEGFKRLLMTGSAVLSTPTPQPTVQAHPAPHGLGGDGGSSTDASSTSRQSIFEPIHEPHPESPRTSHEISEPEDERRWATKESASSTAGRKKPPPPSSRHGKLIKVELKDDPSVVGLGSPTTPGSLMSQSHQSSSPRESVFSQTDLNKPLPAPPNRASNDLDRESVFDKEAAGKVPEPPSPSASVKRKKAPVPPLARRHSQRIADPAARGEPRRLSPNPEEEDSRESVVCGSRSRSDSFKAPPPPPARRPGSIRIPSHSTAVNYIPSPVPASARGSMLSISGRPPSISSMDMPPTPNKRASIIPPPPPPPRHPRSSTDSTTRSAASSRRPSVDQPARRADEARRSSSASLIQPPLATSPSGRSASGGMDILADLTALQEEIDALRKQGEESKIT